MKLVTQTEVLAEAFGGEECIRILAKAGFDAADVSFFGMEEGKGIWCNEGFREYALCLKEIGEECGLDFAQAHAPFPSSLGKEPYDTEIKKWIIRSMEAASLMGVKDIVVHPIQHLNYMKNREQLFKESLEFYRSLIPYCEKFHIRVCAENMWQYDDRRKHIVDSVCSCPEEFNGMLDELNSPWIVGCLDLGHCALVGREPADFIHAMGKERLKALHVHDVNYVDDCHTMPFLESLDWNSITYALAQIGYEGNFTFEADSFLKKMPKELMPEAARLMARTGRYLIERIEAANREMTSK